MSWYINIIFSSFYLKSNCPKFPWYGNDAIWHHINSKNPWRGASEDGTQPLLPSYNINIVAVVCFPVRNSGDARMNINAGQRQGLQNSTRAKATGVIYKCGTLKRHFVKKEKYGGDLEIYKLCKYMHQGRTPGQQIVHLGPVPWWALT